MRRVLGAGLLVVLLGGVHAVRWLRSPAVSETDIAAARVAHDVGLPALPVVAQVPAGSPHSLPDRYHQDPLRFLSTAPTDSLQLLPGIGPVLAARILAQRDLRGPFVTWMELDRVHGIGPVTIRRLRDAARRP